jgi:hypothetical protein
VVKFLQVVTQRVDLVNRLSSLSKFFANFTKNVKARLVSRMVKKQSLLAAFDREFAVMEEYFRQKAKKNKKHKATLKLFTAV